MEGYFPPPSLGIVGIFLVGLAISLYWLALPEPIRGIPYNRASTWHPLGDALDFLFYGWRHGDMFGLMPARLREMDTPIMQIFVRPLQRPWVILSDPQEANDIFTRRTKEFDRSKFFGELLEPLLPQNHVHMPTGPEWKAHRRLINDTMSSGFLHEVAGPLFWSTTRDMIEMWRHKLRLAKGRPFPAAHDISSTALEVVWHASFGFDPGAIKAQIALLSGTNSIPLPKSTESAVTFPQAQNPDAFEAIMTLTHSLDIAITSIAPRVHHTLALKLLPGLRASVRHKDALIQERMEIAKQKVSNIAADDSSNKHYTCVIDLVAHREKIMAEKEGREPVFVSRVIADELFGFLFAGHETTSTTICWGVKFISQDQRVQSKLRASLQASFADSRATGDQPSIGDIISHEMPYLEAVIAEIHRKAMTVPAVSRTALVDTTVLGHHVPKGTNIFFLNSGPGSVSSAIPVSEGSRSLQAKEKWAAWDPATVAEFIPERWLKMNDAGVEVFDAQAGPSLPFGAGPRACFGRKWAQLELRVILMLVVWNFELLTPPPALASFKAVDRIAHNPQQCYVRLAEIDAKS